MVHLSIYIKMNFHITQYSTLPYLEVYFPNIFQNNIFYKRLKNSTVNFTMIDSDCDKKIINCSPAKIIELPADCLDYTKYIIQYKFTKRQTKKKGKFHGTFRIEFLDNGEVLNLPINNEIIVQIL